MSPEPDHPPLRVLIADDHDLLMDLRMPDISGEEATRQIVEEDSSARVVVLTVLADADGVAGVVRAGACGYLVKDSPIDEVLAAVRAGAGGSAWLSSRAAVAVLVQLRHEEPEARPNPQPRSR